MAISFAVVFLCFLALDTGLKFWLDARQIKSVEDHREEVPKAFAKKITLEAHRKAADYTIAKIKFVQKERWVGLAVILIATFGGLIEFIYMNVTEWLGNGILAQIIIVGAFSLFNELVDLPFSWAAQFGLEQKFGFNTMKPAQFFKDLALSTTLSVIIGVPLLALIFWFWQAAGSYWWLYAWIAVVVFTLGLQWFYPTFIAPLFNKFQNLPEGPLYDRINSLLKRVGFESNGLFVMDASKRNAKGNAYMTGFGKNKRIVFFDTLINKLSPEETEAVLAHELGHYKLKHIFKMMGVSFLLTFIIFAVLNWVSTAPWFYEGLGVTLAEGESHGVALILFFLALPVFTFPFTPLTSIFSRKHEFEADRFAVKNSSGPALITALTKLYSDNASTLTPDRIYSAFYSSHPNAMARINAIKSYEVAK
ncbi:MAG: M48 family metallopeptidase [Burkholderiales bacterium]|nr:M48 family metallopeptidase [Burkholderiales bacterium]